MRIALGVEYDGSRFHGWQKQSHARSVQEEVENAVAKVANHAVKIICAGRTDTGVHGIGQVVHFDSDAQRRQRSWLLGINANLPPDVSVAWVRNVDQAFHARFGALARHYRYIIHNRPTRFAPLAKKVTWVFQPLDVEAMHEAAQTLVGEHDFSTFRALGCQAHHPVRTIHALQLQRSGDFIYLDVKANAFLHHMVRNIAGVLITIGREEKPVSWVEELLTLRDRRQGGVTAPPDGLYFCAVEYPQGYKIPPGSPPPVFG